MMDEEGRRENICMLPCTSQLRANTNTGRCIWRIITTISYFRLLLRILRTFTANIIIAKPTSTERHKRSIFVSDINTIDLDELEKAVGAVVPDNSVVRWSCQDYVMEVLEKFEEQCIVDADEEAYINAKKELMEHYGPL